MKCKVVFAREREKEIIGEDMDEIWKKAEEERSGDEIIDFEETMERALREDLRNKNYCSDEIDEIIMEFERKYRGNSE